MIIELIAVLVGKAALAPLKAGLSILADLRDRRVRQVVERVGPLERDWHEAGKYDERGDHDPRLSIPRSIAWHRSTRLPPWLLALGGL